MFSMVIEKNDWNTNPQNKKEQWNISRRPVRENWFCARERMQNCTKLIENLK